MTQQGRIRRSSLEVAPASVGFPDPLAGPSSIDQDTFSLLLAASAQNGYCQDAGAAAAAAGLQGKMQMPFMASTLAPASAPGPIGFDPCLMESEEPGPLPCLPRTRALGSGGPYGSSSAALMMQHHHHQQQQSPGGYPGGASRQGRPRRHSVTIGMLNEHQQQQQAAAYAAALAAAQQNGFAGAGMHSQPAGAAGMGLLGQQGRLHQMQQQHHQQPAGAASPAKQQLQALSNVQAIAAAAQLGMGASSLLASLNLHQQEQLSQQLAAVSSGPGAAPMGMGDHLADFGVDFNNMNAPRLPNAGGCRRHSWAPTGVNGSTAYAQALLLQQQQQRQLAAAAAMGDPRGLLGMNGITNLAKQKSLGGVVGPPAAGYANGTANYLNGHSPAGGSAHPGGFAGLSAAAAAAAMAQLSGLQGAGGLAAFDAASEQHLHQLLQLQQQAGLAAGQPLLDSYMEAMLDPGQGLGQPSPAAVLPGAAPVPALPAGLLPAAVAATTHLTALGLDADGLSPAAAAAAASMYAPLTINGVTLDSQLLVAPFADNWDVMCAQGQAGITPHQLAAAAALGGQLGGGYGGGVKSPRAGNPAAAPSAGAAHAKHQKGLPARSGSCGSSSSNGSTNGTAHSASNSTTLPALPHTNGRTTAAANSSSSAGAAAALAAASMVAAPPPMANVCSDAPWDLKKAAEEDAKVLAAQEGRVQRLMSALERSQTLAKARAAHAATSAAADAGGDAANDGNSLDRAQPVLFGYKLPDTGADAWGGSSSSAVLESAPGSGCISQEPSNKLFVGNIGWWVTEDDLLHWFSRFGSVVHVKIMYNSRKMHKPKDKWRSREYGFIDYATPEEAAKAIVWMDGVELPDLMKDTCGIIVQYAKPTGGNGVCNGNAATTPMVEGSSHAAGHRSCGPTNGYANGYTNGVTAS